MKKRPENQHLSRRPIPPEFRRLALNCAVVKEILAEWDGGCFVEWEQALTACIFALVAENDRLQQRGAA
jgi:hypothetical protein